jgi:hypothetical protein
MHQWDAISLGRRTVQWHEDSIRGSTNTFYLFQHADVTIFIAFALFISIIINTSV